MLLSALVELGQMSGAEVFSQETKMPMGLRRRLRGPPCRRVIRDQQATDDQVSETLAGPEQWVRADPSRDWTSSSPQGSLGVPGR